MALRAGEADAVRSDLTDSSPTVEPPAYEPGGLASWRWRATACLAAALGGGEGKYSFLLCSDEGAGGCCLLGADLACLSEAGLWAGVPTVVAGLAAAAPVGDQGARLHESADRIEDATECVSLEVSRERDGRAVTWGKMMWSSWRATGSASS